MTALIRLSGITRTYRLPGGLGVPVLHGIDLDVGEGEFVALMGPSGSGKTTLLHIIGCLDRPDGGSYLLGGDEVGSLSDHRLAQVRGVTIGFVFQAFHLIPQLHIVDNVALPLLYHGVGRRERHRRAAVALERVGLGHRLHHRPTQLSGGEQQRCAIARALVNQPRLLVADEPTGNLDSKIGAEVLALFDALHAEGLTIVLVTHDAGVGARAQRVVRMRDGRLEAAA
jgi:putative ABC transport system ATP-binding protein